MRFLLICFALILTGCASSPRYNIDMNVSELSEAITTAREDDSDKVFVPVTNNHLKPNKPESYEYTYYEPVGDESIDYVSTHKKPSTSPESVPSIGNDHPNVKPLGRLMFGRRTVVDKNASIYRIDNGNELSIAVGTVKRQGRLAVHYQGANFISEEASGFHKPWHIGLDLDYQWRYPIANIAFFVGPRITTTSLQYKFKVPLVIDGDTLRRDRIGLFGFGIPFGMNLTVGEVTFEVLAAPTLYQYDQFTSLGFSNSLFENHIAIPVSVSIGY